MIEKMCSKVTLWWGGLEGEAEVRKKEIFLEIMVAFLGGIVIGFLFSPKKYTKVACDNSLVNTENNGQEEGKCKKEGKKSKGD